MSHLDPPTARAALLDAALADHLSETVALALWRLGAVRVAIDQPFRLASGASSPLYIDCRLAVSSPVTLQLFTAAIRHRCDTDGLVFDIVAGGETAGIPFAAFLAAALGKPMIYVRKKPKGYGTSARIEGCLEPGARVLLVEDLITDGGSKLGFLDAITAASATVSDVAVLFDREQGGGDLLADRGIRLHAVTGRATTLAVGRRCGLLDDEAHREVDLYFEDPLAWQERRGLTVE